MSDYYGDLASIGSWRNGYRPTKIRVTAEGVPAKELHLHDVDDTEIVWDLNYESGKEIDIPAFSKDIGRLTVGGHNSEGYFRITNIEFYPEP